MKRSAPRSMRSSRVIRLQHWVERLGANDVPFAPINRIDQVVQDPQVRHLGLVVPVERRTAASRPFARPCSSTVSGPSA